MPLRSGPRARRRQVLFFPHESASRSNQDAFLIAIVFVRINLTFTSEQQRAPAGRSERIINYKVVDTNSVFITTLPAFFPFLFARGENETSFE